MVLFKISFSKGIFPDELKIVKLTPIFKPGECNSVSNYGPISVLPSFYKILERLVYNRLYKYLKNHNTLYDKQFGFQKYNSTDHALMQLVGKNVFNENEFTIGVFIDSSKAFDTEILLDKLKHYGIKGNNWFSNYLTNRK